MNLPNRLTMLRLCLVPVVMLFLLPLPGLAGWNDFAAGPAARVIALLAFILASVTDWYDGRIARSRNLVTDFGKLFDPIADKLLVLGTFLAFVQLGRVHGLVLLLIMFREFLITGIRQIAAAKGKVIAASMLGKWKTVTQMICLIWLLLEALIGMRFPGAAGTLTLTGNLLIALAVLMTLFSGYDYLKKNLQMILPA